MNDIHTNVNVNFSNGEELIDITVFCESDLVINTINKIKEDHQIHKELYESIHIQIGSDLGNNATIEFYIHGSQYLQDDAKKKIIEYIDSIKYDLLNEIKKIE